MANRERDAVSGTETTGHEWDGIRELDNPLPRWWLYVFYGCVLWAIGYWIAMPAWPLVSDYSKGVLGYSQRATVERRIEAARAAQAGVRERIAASSLEQIRNAPDLLEFALAGGRSAFAVNCAQCHGTGAAGSAGYPNLNDDAWLWGGTLEDIYATIRFGIRSAHGDTRVSDMPAFLRDGLLTREQVQDVTDYVLTLSGRTANAAASERGKVVFADQCVACHGEDGKGKAEVGAPDLTDADWLYGGGRAQIVQTVAYSRRGVMPAWEGKLDPATLKQLAVYVHSLGGGK
ncbi:MAG: cytochrome-c oxidase, cbb3-type subunit III [Rhodospirillales bacterium]